MRRSKLLLLDSLGTPQTLSNQRARDPSKTMPEAQSIALGLTS